MSTVGELKSELNERPRRRTLDGPPRIPDHEMHRVIGRGSYGEVWLARSAVGTWRAVKVVYRDRFKDHHPYEREFVGIQKYEPISRTNEGLVDVLQIGRNDAEGYFYYVMELADDAGEAGGSSEAAKLEHKVSNGPLPSTLTRLSPRTYIPHTLSLDLLRRGRLSFEECVTLGLKLNLALGHLHRHGLIHRDVKPPNIIFVDGVPKLADIGLVANLTGANSYVGTEGYVAPEGPNSPQADLFALGKVLYEISMGKDRQQFPAPLTGLGTDVNSKGLMELNAILLRACATNPSQRYRSAEEMNADLALLLSGKSVRQKHAVERRLKLTTRVAVAAVAVLLLAVFPYLLAIREARSAKLASKEARASERRATEARTGEAQARATAEQRLYDSLLGEARAIRMARRVGYRDKVFALLKQAGALQVVQKDVTDLRREAAACLGDFVGLTPTIFSDFPRDATIHHALLDPTGQSAVFLLRDGMVLLRRLPSGEESARFQLVGNLSTRSLCFNRQGDKLIFIRLPREKRLEDRIPGARLNVWTRGTDDQWSEAEDVALPGALDCLSTARGVFITAYTGNPRSGKLIEASTKNVVRQFACPPDPIPEVTLSPDGKVLVTETRDSADPLEFVLDVWSVDTGERLTRLRPQLGVLRSLNFSPNGKYLMCSGESHGAIYEFPEGRRVAGFNAQAREPLIFAPGGETVAMPISREYRVRLWDWVRNEEFAVLDEQRPASLIDFAPDGSLLLTVGLQDARLYLLAQTPERLKLLPHLGNRTGVAFSPDGLRLATVGLKPAVRVCDAATLQEVWKSETVPTQGHSPVFSRDGRWLATADFAGKRAFIWDARTGERLLEVVPKAGGRLWSVQLSPDGRYLATGSGIDRVEESGVELWALEASSPTQQAQGLQATQVASLGGSAWSLTFSPDGGLLAYADRALGGVYVWEPGGQGTPRCLGTNLIHRIGNDQSLSFTPDSRQLLFVDSSRAVVTVDVATGELVASFSTVDLERTPSWTDSAGICLSPEGSKLAMTTPSGCGVDIWEPRKAKLLYALPETDDTVHWLAWSPDSQRLAIARSNGSTEVWRLEEVEKVLAKLALSP